MVDLNPVNAVGNVNWKAIIGSVGYLIAGIIVIAIAGGIAWWYFDKKKYSKKTTDFEIVSNHYVPAYRDVAKVSKLGKGGFQILYLKKAKTWRLSYGGRVGRDTYYFFIGKDGYPYNGMLGSDILTIDKAGGLIPVITTNPTMRAQYTALEKHIETLHGEQKSWIKENLPWILTGFMIMLIGVFGWLMYKEMAPFLGKGTELANQMNLLAENMNKLAINLNNANAHGTPIAQPGTIPVTGGS